MFALVSAICSYLHENLKVKQLPIFGTASTRMRDDQRKCLPYFACKNPTPLLFQKMTPKFEESFPLVCRACQDESIDRVKTDISDT